jgi:RNA-binding protein Musashi
MDQSGYNNGGDQSYGHAPMQEENYGPINVKEDG